MNVKPIPSHDEYVASQRDFNLLHTDGSSEAFVERAFWHIDNMLTILKRYSQLQVKTILFAGCRTGYEIRHFLEKCPRVEATGIDIVPEFVEVADHITDSFVMDMHNLTFPDNHFDIVFSSQSLEHCYDTSKALSEMLRVAKQAVYISIPLEGDYSFGLNPSHFTASTHALDWLELLRPHLLQTWQLQYVEVVEKGIMDFMVCRNA